MNTKFIDLTLNNLIQNLNKIKERYDCDVGYSGHWAGLSVSYATAMFDISSLERHITPDKSMYGSDQSASIELRAWELTSVIRKMHESVGEIKTGHILAEEIKIAKKLRAHIKQD